MPLTRIFLISVTGVQPPPEVRSWLPLPMRQPDAFSGSSPVEFVLLMYRLLVTEPILSITTKYVVAAASGIPRVVNS